MALFGLYSSERERSVAVIFLILYEIQGQLLKEIIPGKEKDQMVN